MVLDVSASSDILRRVAGVVGELGVGVASCDLGDPKSLALEDTILSESTSLSCCYKKND